MNHQHTILLRAVFFAAGIFCTVAAKAQSGRPVVYSIHAEADSTKSISVTWKLADSTTAAATSLLLFRSSKPFASTVDLMDIRQIAKLPPSAVSYKDSITVYREYYYAVIVDTAEGPYRIILPSINATVNGAHTKSPVRKDQVTQESESADEKLYPAGTLRETPLPSLDILEGQAETPVPMSKAATEAASELSGPSADKKVYLQPYAFEEDMISPPGGDDYLLFDALHTTFARRLYADGIIKLNDFLSINRDKKVTSRAVFYLGECEYFTGDYRSAILTFLKIQDEYPVLTRQWIDSSLDLINIPD